jgi:hypothetical protein
MTPFDFINSITDSKTNLIVDDVAEKEYNAFMVNRGLSQYSDCVLYANEMNMIAHVDKKLQNDYFLNSITKKKRFSKWGKKKKDENLDFVMSKGYSLQKAREIISLIPEDKLEEIVKSSINK